MSPAEVTHAGIRIVGLTLAGEESFVALPELDIAFDIGRCPAEVISINHIFLSHGHMDHAAGVAYYFSQRMFVDNAPGHLYAPEPLVAPLRKLMRLWADIDGHEPPANIHPAIPGVDIPVRRDLVVRPFEVNHPCRRHDRSIVRGLGFAAIEIRNKLLPEFRDKTGPELVELKKQGIAITRRVEYPLVAHCGDTAVGPFLEHEFVRKAKVLLLECTFVEPEHYDRARAGAHVHLSDLPKILPALENERILLIHLTRRTLLHDARQRLVREIGESEARRVSFLMEHRGRRRGAKPKPSA